MLPTAGIVSTKVAQAKPAVTRPSAARRDHALLAKAQANRARAVEREHTALRSLLGEQLARPTERESTALLESLLEEQVGFLHTKAAHDRELRLARAELAPGQELTIPAMPIASDDAAPLEQVTYIVVPGDSLWAIAQKHWGNGTLWKVIYDANRGTVGPNPNLIFPNQQLTIPAKPPLQQSPVGVGPSAPSIAAGNYTIKSGDTLSHIALWRYGNANRWPEIWSKNYSAIGANPHLIFPGTVLSLP